MECFVYLESDYIFDLMNAVEGSLNKFSLYLFFDKCYNCLFVLNGNGSASQQFVIGRSSCWNDACNMKNMNLFVIVCIYDTVPGDKLTFWTK